MEAEPEARRDPPDQARLLRDRALSGAVLLTVRGFAIRVVGLVGYFVLARLLSPRDFGVAAFGLSLVFFAHFIADAGLGAALIRQPTDPTEADYASVAGVQLAVMSAAVIAAGAWLAVSQSKVAAVAVMYAASVPLLAFRLPSAISLERRLGYRPLVLAEFAEVLAYTVWAIGAVLLGFGVYGLASGAIFRTLVGTMILNRLGPIGWLRPAVDFGRVRRLLGFGVIFQLSSAVSLLRDQGINIGTAAILGYPTLGLWTLVSRVITIPLLVFESLWRVSFPALSRMLQTDEDVDGLMSRSVGSAGFIGGLLFVPMAIAMPLVVPAVIGHTWAPALDVLPYILFGLLASQPISVVATGYLLAKGAAGALLRVNIGLSAVNLALAFALMPLLGYRALGVGQAAGSVADGWLLATAVRAQGGPRLLRTTLGPMAFSAAAFGLAEASRALLPDDLSSIFPVAGLGAACYLSLALAFTPETVRNAVRLTSSLRRRI